jgi:CRP-like cAMP-binding protein
MATSETEVGQRRVTFRTRTRRKREELLTERFFDRYPVSIGAHGAFEDAGKPLWGFNRDTVFRGGGQHRVLLVVAGCVREDHPDGRVRLWCPGTLLGDWSGTTTESTQVTLLTNRTIVSSVSVPAIFQLTQEYPELAYALAAKSMQRLEDTEKVYGARKRSVLAQVSQLLSWLSSGTMAHEKRGIEGRFVLTHGIDGVVQGPTRADLADALGVSKAAVEKALAELRTRDLVTRPSGLDGSRANRLYVILDRARLDAVARTA